MGTFSIWHLIVIVVLVVLLFGRGKVSELMGDVAKGIKNFRKGMEDDPKPQPPAQVTQQPVPPPVNEAPRPVDTTTKV